VLPKPSGIRGRQFLGFFEERFLILAAVRLKNHSQRCAALLLKQSEQLLHVLSAGSKVHGSSECLRIIRCAKCGR
jgi:hypothetical protein